MIFSDFVIKTKGEDRQTEDVDLVAECTAQSIEEEKHIIKWRSRNRNITPHKNQMKKISCLIVFLICSLSNLLRKVKRNFRNFIEMLISEDSSSSSSSSSEDENSVLNQQDGTNKIIRLRRYKRLKKWAKDDQTMLYTFKPYKMVPLKYDKNLKYPAARSGHRIICTESNIYLLGGFNPEMASISQPAVNCLFKEFWKYNIATRKWELLVHERTKNMPRELASNAIVMYRNAVIVSRPSFLLIKG